jgi:hypothetical protein
VLTDYELHPGELATLQSSFTYTTENRPHQPEKERMEEEACGGGGAGGEQKQITVTEALKGQAGGSGNNAAGSASRSTRRMSSVDEDDEEEDEEGELIVEWQDDSSETRKLLSRGISCRLHLRMTPRCGWGLFTSEDIAKGSFVCEYVGEVLPPPAADRRMWEHISLGGSHPVFQFAGVRTLDGETHIIDPSRSGGVGRFVNHACDANLVCRAVLEETRLAMYAVCDIQAGEELTCDYAYDASGQIGPTFICGCGETNCQRTLL